MGMKPTMLLLRKIVMRYCAVEILIAKEIFDEIPEGQGVATLEGEGRVIIGMNGKTNDAAAGNRFEISVDL